MRDRPRSDGRNMIRFSMIGSCSSYPSLSACPQSADDATRLEIGPGVRFPVARRRSTDGRRPAALVPFVRQPAMRKRRSMRAVRGSPPPSARCETDKKAPQGSLGLILPGPRCAAVAACAKRTSSHGRCRRAETALSACAGFRHPGRPIAAPPASFRDRAIAAGTPGGRLRSGSLAAPAGSPRAADRTADRRKRAAHRGSARSAVRRASGTLCWRIRLASAGPHHRPAECSSHRRAFESRKTRHCRSIPGPDAGG